MHIKKLHPNAIVPTKGSVYAAGYDLYACLNKDVLIPPHATVLIDTGWAMEIPMGFFGGIYARSGLATKEGLRPANCVGIVDSDYRGPVKVALHNDTNENKIVKNGERIAQLVLAEYYNIDFQEVAELEETDRGEGGFGSSGK